MKTLVFGCGRYYELKKNAVQGKIVGFLDNYKKDAYYEDIRIYRMSELKELDFDMIYVMADRRFFPEMVYALLEMGIERDKIVIGQNLTPYLEGESFLSDSKNFTIDDKNKLCYSEGTKMISFRTYDELNGILDVFLHGAYNYVSSRENFVVIDIGMNIGAASLYFAYRDDVVKVYSYEPFQPTYLEAVYNVERNSNVADKIILHNVGLDDVNADRKIEYNSEMSCGMSTDAHTTNMAAKQYLDWGLYKQEKSRTETVRLVKASEEIGKIITENPCSPIILKIDCEGAEERILQDLSKNNWLKGAGVYMIMLEWHYKNNDMIKDILKENQFAFFSFPTGRNMGVIYAVKEACFMPEK